jgi:hypothetical protein
MGLEVNMYREDRVMHKLPGRLVIRALREAAEHKE